MKSSRRSVMKAAGGTVAATAFAGLSVPYVHAAEENEIRVALVGCGGRGTGAALNALRTKGPIKLVAMADVFPDKMEGSHKSISAAMKEAGQESRVDVPKERQFIGFDGYKKAMDCLRPGDVIISATPPAFRWVHFTYAIEKGLNAFMDALAGVGPRPKILLTSVHALLQPVATPRSLDARRRRAHPQQGNSQHGAQHFRGGAGPGAWVAGPARWAGGLAVVRVQG
ncbi:MAG: hypothetical protein ACKOS8_13520, partial [Gemmataceae bacterium]